MPKRLSTRKYISAEIQGEDSFIVVSRLTVGEAREIHKLNKRRQQADDGLEEEDAMAAVLPLYAQHVIDWNWVDDEEEPLPLPGKNPEILDTLTDLEFSYIADILSGENEEEEKNS